MLLLSPCWSCQGGGSRPRSRHVAYIPWRWKLPRSRWIWCSRKTLQMFISFSWIPTGAPTSSLNMQYLQELSDTWTPESKARRLLWDSLKHNAVRYNFENLGYETVTF